MLRKAMLIAAVTLGTASFALAAGPAQPKYELRRIGMGPRAPIYMPVRVYPERQEEQSAAPYALTGERQQDQPRERQLIRWPAHHRVGRP